MVLLELISNRWLGVRASGSIGSSLTLVIGRPFIMHSTSHITVCKTSSVILPALPNRAINSLRTVRIMRSHNPPLWEASGGLKHHSMSLFAVSIGAIWFILRKLSDNSLCAPTKFVPLSENTFSGQALLATNLKNPFKNSSDSRLRNTYILDKQVYMQPYRLTSDLPCLTRKGPNKSTPV